MRGMELKGGGSEREKGDREGAKVGEGGERGKEMGRQPRGEPVLIKRVGRLERHSKGR